MKHRGHSLDRVITTYLTINHHRSYYHQPLIKIAFNIMLFALEHAEHQINHTSIFMTSFIHSFCSRVCTCARSQKYIRLDVRMLQLSKIFRSKNMYEMIMPVIVVNFVLRIKSLN